MKLTVEQTLKQAVSFHEEGNLQKAERLYRAILQSQPTHADANHNLGVLAVSGNKTDAALPLLKIALKANPRKKQFWFSYIDALIKDQQFEAAKKVIEQVKKKGMAAENLTSFQKQLLTLTQTSEPQTFTKKKASTFSERRKKLADVKKQKKQLKHGRNPPEAELNDLLLMYQHKRFIEAKTLALSFSKKFPGHPLAWKLLPDILQKTGSTREALTISKKAVELFPKDAGTHHNLGNTLNELGRLEEAIASHTQAIRLNPSFFEAHIDLGNTLLEMGKLEEAEVSYSRAAALQPKNADAHNNLCVVLKDLGRLEEAKASGTHAIALKPNFAYAHNNLGVALKELGRLEEAKISFTQAIELNPDFTHAIWNLSNNLSYMNDLGGADVALQRVFKTDPSNTGLRAGVNLSICRFLEANFSQSKEYLLSTIEIHQKTSAEYQSEKIFHQYLLKILNDLENKERNYNFDISSTDKVQYIIGDSHSLVSHHLRFLHLGSYFYGKAKLIKGCKQWHLGNPNKNQYKAQLEGIFHSLAKPSEILLVVGEIDCRLDSGIIVHKNKYPDKKLEDIIVTTIDNYLNYISTINCGYQHNITIQGVPCPNVGAGKHEEKEIVQLKEVIRSFNFELRARSKRNGFGFLDVHKLTDRGDGISNKRWHVDDYHLSADGVLEARSQYIS
ncbi:tetratricopeptide repeat protein [Gammaproteobacteria bacterium]|nr:tetratricopeptide repeat protein [Gammaproteobacteria bacterium]